MSKNLDKETLENYKKAAALIKRHGGKITKGSVACRRPGIKVLGAADLVARVDKLKVVILQKL